ncbi:2-C-methyl-D-erythritol 4-phosphate cytidylyltransferase [hydrothermal vent metagenome]|uniref:2-C-methyl-D-erythritol 4-phosphate cytidylyltransferase n=1 Tax=hydrothermal vent metagenome TaxID=652676 RepID=A0A3B0WN25_9ZZZZ
MQKNQYWAIIPAAGIGKRMQANKPKQYLPLYQKTVIEHTLDRLLSLIEIKGVVLSISDVDEYWQALNYQSDKPILVATGGKERSDSVLNALELLSAEVIDIDTTWVLVHDAARPCVRPEDIKNLINIASNNDNGGLLALPVRDTMKRAKKYNQIEKTVAREGLWHALTPQMFRLDCLKQALLNAIELNEPITDDASAMEIAGYSPLLVEAHEDNIKITRAFDLKLAEIFLQNQMDKSKTL